MPSEITITFESDLQTVFEKVTPDHLAKLRLALANIGGKVKKEVNDSEDNCDVANGNGVILPLSKLSTTSRSSVDDVWQPLIKDEPDAEPALPIPGLGSCSDIESSVTDSAIDMLTVQQCASVSETTSTELISATVADESVLSPVTTPVSFSEAVVPKPEPSDSATDAESPVWGYQMPRIQSEPIQWSTINGGEASVPVPTHASVTDGAAAASSSTATVAVKRKYNKFGDSVAITLKRLKKQVDRDNRVPQEFSEDEDSELERIPLPDYEPCVMTYTCPVVPANQPVLGQCVSSKACVPVLTSILQLTAQDMRRTMRKKMFRCRVCKNRYIERDIFERHMKERHPEHFERYQEEKGKREEKERLEYLQHVKIQEERENRRNQRLAEIYEERLKLQELGQEVGPPPLPEEIFPPPMPRPPTPLDELSDVVREKRMRRMLRVCPQCSFCDKRFKNDYSLRKHIAKRHPDCINFVQCNKCYQAVRDVDELNRHNCDITYVCTECFPPRNLTTMERLYNHIQKFHRGEQLGYPCDECGKRFQTERKLRKHKRMTHIIQKPYKCQFCNEYFPTDMAVCVHERIHTGRVRWECDICDYKTNRKTKVAEHKRQEHGYLCMLCGDSVEDWPLLKEHTLHAHQGYLCKENQDCAIVSPRVWVLFKGE